MSLLQPPTRILAPGRAPVPVPGRPGRVFDPNTGLILPLRRPHRPGHQKPDTYPKPSHQKRARAAAARQKAREAAEAARVAIDGKVARAADRWNNPNLYGPTLIRLVRLLAKRRAVYKATASALPRRRR